MTRRKKWQILSELVNKIEEDSQLDNCIGSLECLCYAPNIGYRSWIFKYKGVRVALFDAGNGHYSFHMPVTWLDTLVARVREKLAW